MENSTGNVQASNNPCVGDYYSPFKDGEAMVLRLVKEDECYYYFEDMSKYPKDLPWWWFKRDKPKDKTEIGDDYIFPYESYSLWSRQLAESYTVDDLQKVVDKCEDLADKYARQHLSAIKATTSMQSQSQRRAHARNNVTGNYERKKAYLDAIELHRYYPEKCKCLKHTRTTH